MAQQVTRRPTAPIQVERVCALCRGAFFGPGYQKGGSTYCCDVCARRASGPGFLFRTLMAAGLVGLGYFLSWRRQEL